jgi:hypothetical protein
LATTVGSPQQSWRELVDSVARGGPCKVGGVCSEIAPEQLRELFDAAPSEGDATGAVKVLKDADFRNVTFVGPTTFSSVQFKGDATFAGAVFKAATRFTSLSGDRCSFDRATFCDDLYVHGWESRRLTFERGRFASLARFIDLTVEESLSFSSSEFTGATVFSNIQSASFITFVATTFATRVSEFEAACHFLSLLRVRLDRGGLLYLHGGSVDLSRAELGAATVIAGRRKRASADTRDRGLDVSDASWKPRLSRMEGTDVERLVLQDVDLAQCFFRGCINLDRLRLEGMCEFDCPPPGLHRGKYPPFVWFWTPRLSVVEERMWRRKSRNAPGWRTDTTPAARKGDDRRERQEQAEALAKVYRALRKGREASSNSPGAGDFYYGEMEMRRMGMASIGERFVLWLYWLLSGYGLRPLRPLIALAVLVGASSLLLFEYGLADGSSYSTSLLASLAAVVNVEVLKPDQFRVSGQWIRTVLKVLGPALFGLLILAFWGRVKR